MEHCGDGKMNGTGRERAEQIAEQKQRQEDLRNSMLSHALDQDALARLNTLRMTRPDKAALAEQMIISSLQRGMIREKFKEENLVQLLTHISKQDSTNKQSKITFQRRRNDLDDSEDDDA